MALIGLAVGAAATAAMLDGGKKSPERAQIEAIVHDYILAHPEILPEAMERLQSRDTARAIQANRSAIEVPYGGAWEGNGDGDVTLVEFFDYACGYCRGSIPDIDRLLKEDPGLKVVYREFPVLGLDSEAAARLALAAARGANYAKVHRALYASGRPDGQARQRVARAFGVSPVQNAADIAELVKNRKLQQALNLTGTPSWVIGDRLLSGAVGYTELKRAVEQARSAKAVP